MSIFHHQHVAFSKIDPLANGLADEIAAEQQEADSIRSLEDVSAEELNRKWNVIVDDIKKDPEWFNFADD
ncbi:MAG: hypothetical protein EOO17_04770 [Chloroflexi bacterium]|nr:MAG: hypothetical protein EOO17_04770 [Chloroflexota bacterium]